MNIFVSEYDSDFDVHCVNLAPSWAKGDMVKKPGTFYAGVNKED